MTDCSITEQRIEVSLSSTKLTIVWVCLYMCGKLQNIIAKPRQHAQYGHSQKVGLHFEVQQQLLCACLFEQVSFCSDTVMYMHHCDIDLCNMHKQSHKLYK